MKTLNTLRQHLLEKRLSLNGDVLLRERLEEGFIQFLDKIDNATLAIYWPINSEFDPRPIALNWARKSSLRKLVLPVVKIGEPLSFAEWHDGDTLIKGPQGIPEPIVSNENKLILPDIILLPCLGWSQQDGQIWRIGYGGGYYDRTLAALKSNKHPLKTVGVSFQSLEVTEGAWRPQPHDQALDELICA